MKRCTQFDNAILTLLFLISLKYSHAFVQSIRYTTKSHVSSLPSNFIAMKRSRTLCFQSNRDENPQALEALVALADYHQGKWKGSAKSFAVTADVAAGIVQRKSFTDYHTAVRITASKGDFTLTETISWENNTRVFSRTLPLSTSNTDVDAVDGSYSLDASLPDLPASLTGTEKLVSFMVEHCIALSDDERARCWALYGPDQDLIRIVVSQETRIDGTSTIATNQQSSVQASNNRMTAADFEMQSDIDRLVDKITGNSTKNGIDSSLRRMDVQKTLSSTPSSSNIDGPSSLSRHTMSLLELSAGIWLGDTIIRDHPKVPTSPLERGTGFGTSPNRPVNQRGRFGEWSIGVQKVAWRWMWNFGDEIRQVNDAGKAIGAELSEALSQTLPGMVCVNEGLARRIPVEDRMVYVDWSGTNVGFLVGPCMIQVPRFLTFNGQKRQPVVTEFAVFQSSRNSDQTEADSDESPIQLKEVVCSKISRVYNFEGELKQGCTSFYTLKRFGTEKDDV